MQNDNQETLDLLWSPRLVDRGGSVSLKLVLAREGMVKFELHKDDESYFSKFEIRVFEAFLGFVEKRGLSSICDQNFREIENYLRSDNKVAISKNDEEGILLVDDLKYFLIEEIAFFRLKNCIDDVILLSDIELVSAIKHINKFLDEEFNSSFYIGLFNQKLKLESFSKGKVVFIIENLIDNASNSLVNRIFLKKFGLKQIKLVARHSLSR